MCTLSRTKSIGRLPRSVEMMTQRPVMESLRSSGKTSSWLVRVNILLRVLRGGARTSVFQCKNAQLMLGRVERAFVQAHDGLCAGARFDGQHVEAARGFFDVAGAQKLAGHAREVAALFPIHCFFGGERHGPRGLRRLRRSRWHDNCTR